MDQLGPLISVNMRDEKETKMSARIQRHTKAEFHSITYKDMIHEVFNKTVTKLQIMIIWRLYKLDNPGLPHNYCPTLLWFYSTLSIVLYMFLQ